jgi:hypothetical protein
MFVKTIRDAKAVPDHVICKLIGQANAITLYVNNKTLRPRPNAIGQNARAHLLIGGATPKAAVRVAQFPIVQNAALEVHHDGIVIRQLPARVYKSPGMGPTSIIPFAFPVADR